MSTEYLGATAAFPTGTDIRPPCKSNPSPTTARGNEFNRKEAPVTAAAVLQEASSIPAIRITKMKQAERTVDQLSDRLLEWVSAHRDHTTIVHVLARNTHAQIKMGLPPLAPVRNPLIIEQSRESGTLGKVSVTRRQVESIINNRTSVMTLNIGTAPDPPSAKIIPCILSVPCVRRTERQNANRDSGRNNPTSQHTRCNRAQHLILRTHRTQHIILKTHQTQHIIFRTHWTQYLILRTQSSTRPHPPEISEGSPLYRFLTLVTWVTTDFIQTIKFTASRLLLVLV